MVLYERLCRIGERLGILYTILRPREDRELERAVKFLRPVMTVSVPAVIATARIMALLTLVSLMGLLLSIRLHPIASAPLSIMIAFLVYYAIVTYPVSMMNRYRVELSEESDIMFEQFLLVFEAGGTIFDAIEMVAGSGHPYLSPAFQMILSQIADGIPPERCLMEFAKNQPSDDVRRYITGVVSALEQKTDLLEILSGESYEADLALRSKNLELESRLLIVAALMAYVPMLLTLALSLSGLTRSPLILIFAPIFAAMSVFFRSRFTKDFSAYFDRPVETGIMAPSQREIIQEYEEFLNFLILLGERLRLGDTVEVALRAVRDDLAPEIQRLVDVSIHMIYTEERSLAEAMRAASQLALGQRVARMMMIIPAMAQISAQGAGERLTKMAGRLVKRAALAKERRAIIDAQRLKTYLLTITSAIVLGLLASLSPFLYLSGLIGQENQWPPSGHVMTENWPLVVMLLVTVYSSAHQSTMTVSGSHPRLMGIVCTLLFWTSYVTSSLYLGMTGVT